MKNVLNSYYVISEYGDDRIDFNVTGTTLPKALKQALSKLRQIGRKHFVVVKIERISNNRR